MLVSSRKLFPNSSKLLSPKMLWSVAWFLVLSFLSLLVAYRFGNFFEPIDYAILIGSFMGCYAFGKYWTPFAYLMLVTLCLSYLGYNLYQGQLANAETGFFLKYLLSSQSAIMWMSALFVLACVGYLVGILFGVEFVDKTASKLTFIAVVMGFTGLFVRWYESYLIAPDIGHIPVSSLYEVFILFCLITALMYLFYEQKFTTYRLGFFSLFIITAAVAFILWYTFDRGAHHIQPLVPALNSYWMKIHVPANFIGYAAFAIAAMNSIVWLIVNRLNQTDSGSVWLSRLPDCQTIENFNYRAIALGFVAFTIATILGAMWAAEAWGGYWSWDPKETWALIVWLNYAAWLHFRISKGWHGKIMAYWSIIGLFVTLFAFLGVNMFLSGLHSYGEL